jgi:hypothetical protein
MKTKGFGRAILIAGGAACLCLACTNSYFDNVKKLVDEKTNGPAAAPAFSPAPGNYSTNQSVAISCPTGAAVIFYTTDGSTPTASSPVYTGPVLVAGPATTKTIRAFARISGFQDSVVASGTYVVNYNQVFPPTMTPTGGRLGHAVPVTLSCATPGATIVYTLDGSFPA